jgi:CTD kinase subunit beta
MAPTRSKIEDVDMPDADADADVAGASGSLGPYIGDVKCGRLYIHEITIRRKQASLNVDPAREDAVRLQGVQLIDDVRNYLQL